MPDAERLTPNAARAMIYQIGATAVAMTHFAFIVFVAFGGLLVLRWHTLAWVHLPAAIWGATIEIMQWNCPLTNVENWLLRRAGKQGYTDGFVAHYLFGIIYPAGLTRGWEIAIAAFVIVVNTAVYVTVLPPQKIIGFLLKAKS